MSVSVSVQELVRVPRKGAQGGCSRERQWGVVGADTGQEGPMGDHSGGSSSKGGRKARKSSKSGKSDKSSKSSNSKGDQSVECPVCLFVRRGAESERHTSVLGRSAVCFT